MANEMDDKKLCMGCMRLKEEAERKCPYCGFDEKKRDREDNEALPLRTVLNGKYLLGKPLGRGGFGITYIAYEKNLQIRVAIKEFFPWSTVKRDKDNSLMPVSWKEDSEFFETDKKKVLDEARRLAQLMDLPGVVFVRDFFEENNTAYIVMEYLDGMTLSKYLSSPEGSISPEWVLKAMKPVLASLAKVHKAGIIHRDISPDNMILTSGNRIKLIDFGAARNYSMSRKESLSVILKRGYAPIEQYSSRGNQGPWTDIYALCATMYKMMTGSAPLESTDRIINDEIKTIRGMGISLTPKLEKAIMKGLSINYRERFSNIYELYTALYGKLSAEVISAEEAYDTACELYDERRYKEAILYFNVAADAGDANAMYRLGNIYYSGTGASVNYSQAIKWYKKAADAGNTYAMCSFAEMYRDGNGVVKDSQLALKWFEKAAGAGNTYAMYFLAVMYRDGEGVVKDGDLALEWFEKAAHAGDEYAMYAIADIYRYRYDDDQDINRALEWYEKAADAGNTDAMCRLAEMYRDGNGVVEDGKRAAFWYEMGAVAGNTDAMLSIAEMYRYGDGVDEDIDLALKWYEKLADAGDANAMYNIADMYSYGYDFDQDINRALEWYEKAADAGNTDAMCKLAVMYFGGKCVDQDINRALELFEKAAHAGNIHAMHNLAHIYRCGKGVDQDINRALEWYEKVAGAGNTYAMNALGDMYRNGEEIPQDYKYAMKWYVRAAENGYSESMLKLGDMYLKGEGVEADYDQSREWFQKAADAGNLYVIEKLGFIPRTEE